MWRGNAVQLSLPGQCGGGRRFYDEEMLWERSHKNFLQAPLLRVERYLLTLGGQSRMAWPSGTPRVCVLETYREPAEGRAGDGAVMHCLRVRVALKPPQDILIKITQEHCPCIRPHFLLTGNGRTLQDAVPWLLRYVFLPALNLTPE